MTSVQHSPEQSNQHKANLCKLAEQKQRRAEKQRMYQRNNKIKVAEYARKYYNTCHEYKEKKKMKQAYQRYFNGVDVSNKIVDELRKFYDLDENTMPYKKTVWDKF